MRFLVDSVSQANSLGQKELLFLLAAFAAFLLCMGFNKGFPLVLVTLVLQNIIFIPLLIGLAASGFKFYKSIVKDRRRENIKISFIRHTIFSAIILIGLCLSSVIEVFISTNLLKLISVYF